MKLIVGINEVIIDEKEKINTGEYNVHDIEFEFDDIYENLVKKAVFSAKGHNYLVDISQGKCIMPYEVLEQSDDISIGVFAYETENDELVLRYSPSPCYLHISEGSYKDEYDNYKVPTADVVEQLENEINNKQDRLISGTNIKTINNQSILGEGNIDIQGGGSSYVEGSNIYFTEDIITGATAINAINTIYNDTQVKADITNLQNNKADKSEIPDVSNFITKSVNDLTNYYLKSETYTQSEINSLIGAISTMDIEVVQVLPTEDISTTTIYLVPKTTALVNNIYDEYVYVSNAWEKIGDTQIDVSGKEDISNKVTSISSSSTDTQYPSARCVYNIIGNINTILATLTTPNNNGGN